MDKVNVIWFAMDTLGDIVNGLVKSQDFCSKYQVFHYEWDLLAQGALSRLAATEHPWCSEAFLDFRVKTALTEERATLSPRSRAVGDVKKIMGHDAFRSPLNEMVLNETRRQIARVKQDEEFASLWDATDAALTERNERLSRGRDGAGYTNASRYRVFRLGPEVARHKRLAPSAENLRSLRDKKILLQKALVAEGIEKPQGNKRKKGKVSRRPTYHNIESMTGIHHRIPVYIPE